MWLHRREYFVTNLVLMTAKTRDKSKLKLKIEMSPVITNRVQCRSKLQEKAELDHWSQHFFSHGWKGTKSRICGSSYTDRTKCDTVQSRKRVECASYTQTNTCRYIRVKNTHQETDNLTIDLLKLHAT